MKMLFLLALPALVFVVYTSYEKTDVVNRDGKLPFPDRARHMRENQDKQFDELSAFVAIPSVSSVPAHDADVTRAAEWLVKKLKGIGMTTAEVVQTSGHPVVMSTWNKAKGKPTVLIYGHYDVQPVDEKQWSSKPFEATLRGNRIYGRGATDDKGGLLIPVWAAEAILKEKGALPVNVIFIFDGEEEIGSPHFRDFLKQKKSELKADFAYNADGAQYNDSIPSIWMGLRGSAALEVTVRTANTDAHSGLYSGKTPNAAKVAAQIISSLYTQEGKVAIDGFYDLVEPLTPQEKERLLQVPYDPKTDMRVLGTTAEVGESDYAPLERLWYRPTIEVTGVWGGYTAKDGFANIIPGTTQFRLNCRLVPNQNGQQVIQLVQKHIEKNCPEGATVTYKEFSSYASPIKFPAKGLSFQLAYDVLEETYKRPPILTAIGGSIAAMTDIKDELGLYTYSFGFQQTDENFHAPNEFIRLTDIEKGQKAYCLLFERIGNSKKK